MSLRDSNKKNKKKCTACGENIPFSARAWHPSTCKSCYAQARSKRKTEIRKSINSIKAEMKCEICGFEDPRALHFHHKNPENKKKEIGNLASSGYNLEAIKKEIKKCVVLCANCHAIKHNKKKLEKPSFS